jgi:hypothetical protein
MNVVEAPVEPGAVSNQAHGPQLRIYIRQFPPCALAKDRGCPSVGQHMKIPSSLTGFQWSDRYPGWTPTPGTSLTQKLSVTVFEQVLVPERQILYDTVPLPLLPVAS